MAEAAGEPRTEHPPASDRTHGRRSWRLLRSFGHFWVDFLVGDTPELFVGAVVAVGLGFAWRAAGGSVATMVWLPLAVVVVLGLSLLRAVRRH